jgi:tetratricopeptide (TPR) repeat protein
LAAANLLQSQPGPALAVHFGTFMNLAKRFLVSICLALAGVSVQAAPENITRGELAVIPEFCNDAQTFDSGQGFTWQQGFKESPRSAYWVSLMGKPFWGIHHHCWAMIYLHRAKAAGLTPQARNYLHRTAISDFMYVVNLSTQDMPLLPEIYYRIGESYDFLNEFGSAIEAYKKSRELKYDYWPPYVGHAKVLEKAGLTGQAKKVLEDGLRLMPNERALQAPFVRLGGRLADVVPAPAPAAPAAPVSAAAPPAVGTNAPVGVSPPAAVGPVVSPAPK